MSSHKSAKDLFLAALERPPAERPAFLSEACGGDAAVREEVESLLAFHDEDASQPSAESSPASPAFAPGVVFASRYRMVLRIGRGGMGDVWRADDLMLDTTVALKLIRSTSRTGREQLLNEVRLARQVTHPAVCRVFDVGEADDEVFFSMEYVRGQDLATLLRHAGRLAPAKVADIARQLCGGLAAAHARGVLHRDLKPANILIDEDGQVRITDFGIAVTADGARRHGLAGTPLYMAPEQRVPGAALSPQTDLYALGLVLYELATGVHPLRNPAPARALVPPSALVPDMDRALENVILRALAQDPHDRPASAEAFAAALPREMPAPQPAPAPQAWSRPAPLKRWAWVAAAAIGVIGATLMVPRGVPALTERDTIVLADFQNTTDEPLFGGALKVALAVALEQSPFLRVFPDDRILETLRLMERPPDTLITREVAREIAQREQLKATLSGSIASLGRNYVLALEATNAQTGDVMARDQVEVASKEEVLTALGAAASRLREKLGESLASVRHFDVPLPRATTTSLEALNAYALALEEGRLSVRLQSLPHLQRAIELDPDFALAQALLSGVYANTGQTELAPAYAKRAYDLRDRVSERERFFISWRYHRDAQENWSQGLELARAWTAAYPREAFAFNSLGLASELLGDLPAAVAAYRKAIELDPKLVPPHGNLGDTLLSLGRFDEARDVVRRAEEVRIDAVALHRVAYLLALHDGDEDAMARRLDLARRSREAIAAADWQPRVLALSGRLRDAREGFQRGIQEALLSSLGEWAALFSVQEAEVNAVLGRCPAARQTAAAALGWSRNSATLDTASRALAWCGDGPASEELTAELLRRFPDATLRVRASAPISAAALAIRRGDNARGLALLETLGPYERSSVAKLWPAFLKGHAYLQMHDAANAAAAFGRVTEAPGILLDSVLYPASLLGRARAAVENQDVAAAKQHYEALLDLWRDADADLQVLQDARREYARLP